MNIRKALTLAVASSSQHHNKQDVNHDFKSLHAGQHGSSGATLPEPDCDGIQTASMNEPHIFVWAFIVKKPEVSTKGIEGAENVAESAKGIQSTNATHTFQYDMKKLQKLFADMDRRLRSSKRSGFRREYKKCPSRTLQEVETRSLQILQQGEKKAESGSKPGENIDSTAPNDDDKNLRTKHTHPHTHPQPVYSDSNILDIDIPFEHSRRQNKFLKTAKKIFNFFVPLDFNSALVAKYWGAVYRMLEVKAISPYYGY